MTTDWNSPLQRALHKRVIVSSGCWYYSGKARVKSSNPLKGYPVIRVKVNGQWRMRKIARVVAMVYNIPGLGPEICHSCNDPECWNPKHLRWGTHQENIADKSLAGTTLAGEDHNLVKLSQAQVDEIRVRAHKRESHRSIAEDYPVNRRQISRIISGTRWSKS